MVQNTEIYDEDKRQSMVSWSDEEAPHGNSDGRNRCGDMVLDDIQWHHHHYIKLHQEIKNSMNIVSLT